MKSQNRCHAPAARSSAGGLLKFQAHPVRITHLRTVTHIVLAKVISGGDPHRLGRREQDLQDSRSQKAARVVRRKRNRRHMTGDPYDRATAKQLCWSEPRTRFL